MKDFYFISGVALGALAGMAIMYKSKAVKEAAHKCEEGLMQATKEIKEKVQNKKETNKQKTKSKKSEQ